METLYEVYVILGIAFGIAVVVTLLAVILFEEY